MRLFYTEEEALREKYIHSRGQSGFYRNTILQELTEAYIASPRVELSQYKAIKTFYSLREIKRGKDTILVIYVLEQLKDEAIKIILDTYNKENK